MIKRFLPALAICVLGLPQARAGDTAAEELAGESEQQLETSIIATKIREKGYPCAKIENMVRIKPDDPDIRSAWRVDCQDGDYQVIVIGDQGYRVKRID